MSVCVNIRDAPESLLDYKVGKNYLNYERVSFPMSTDFNVALQRNAEQMNDFKNSHRNYHLYYFLKVVFLLVPSPLSLSFRDRVLLQTMKISMTNLVGPSVPIRLGEKALSKSIMFMNYFRLPYIQFYVFTHCDEIKVGYLVGQINAKVARLMELTDEAIKEFIKKTN